VSVVLALLILLTEVEYGLPPGLLAAVVLHESSGRERLVTPERNGCSVGLGQVYIPGCPARLRRMLQGARYNLRVAATLLVRQRRLCGAGRRQGCCTPHWVQGYNCGSKGYAARVLARWRRLVPRATEATCRNAS
jgi:hypothetical protein